MPHAIIRGNNGRRHEVDFGDAPIRVEIYASDETVEIFVDGTIQSEHSLTIPFGSPCLSRGGGFPIESSMDVIRVPIDTIFQCASQN